MDKSEHLQNSRSFYGSPRKGRTSGRVMDRLSDESGKQRLAHLVQCHGRAYHSLGLCVCRPIRVLMLTPVHHRKPYNGHGIKTGTWTNVQKVLAWGHVPFHLPKHLPLTFSTPSIHPIFTSLLHLYYELLDSAHTGSTVNSEQFIHVFIL